MPYYRCLVNGSGFPGEMVDIEGPVGFYASRSVQALNANRAKALVLARLRREPDFQAPPRPRKRWFQRKAPRGPDMRSANIQFIEVERLEQLPVPRARGRGALWYCE